jgi:site-specific recombinase XerC
MPNPAKGARLYLRKRRGREASWVILDRGKEVATGCDEGNGEQAEKALADYIARKYEIPNGPCHPDQMSIGRALEIYGNERAVDLAAPELVGFHIDALDPFWGDLPVSAIKGATCRAYVKSRTVKPATSRRELETMGAAINYCHKEGYLTHVPRVTLPEKAKGKTRWLTRNEAARLLWAARHVPHLRTFILIGIYTGTRSAAIFGLQWMPNTQGGWIDLDAGLLYRGAEGRIETNKRVPTCSLPTKLLAHLRRGRKGTMRFVVEYDGERVQKLRRSWKTARLAAGLGSDVTPHTLRHTSVTWRLLKGVPLRDVAEYVGMSEKMARETYGHYCPDHLEKARDAI